MAERKIPLGIAVITILMYIQAIVGIAGGIFLIVDQDALAHDLGAGPIEVTASMVLGWGIAAIVVGIITGLLAYGLRQASNAVRILVAVVMVLWIAAAIYALIWLPGARGQGLIQGLVALVVLYFLYGDEDSKAFFA